MLKFVAIFVCFASLACAAPVDSKSESSTGNGSTKTNFTENASDNYKAASPYFYNSGAYYGYPQPGVGSSSASYYSAPAFHTPVVSSPLAKPLTSSYSSFYTYPSLFRGSTNQGKTGHLGLRPQLYQAQPQVYAYPIQSYPQTVHSYSSYQPVIQSYYGNYGYDYYKQAKEMGNQEPVMVMQQTPTTRILVEKPISTEQVSQIPVGQDQQVSNIIPRDASSYYAQASLPYTALPQDTYGQIEDMRRRDILIDDKYKMHIQPSYLMDRLHLQPNPASMISGRSAEDSVDSNRLTSAQYAPVGSEDDVFVVMNQYDQHPVVAKAALEETSAFQPIANSHVAGSMNSMWMQPVFNAPAAPLSGRDSGNMPFSHDNIMGSLQQYYLNEYYKQMEKANLKLSQPRKATGRSADEQFIYALAEELSKKFDQAATSSKKTEASQPVKSEEKKENSTTLAPKN